MTTKEYREQHADKIKESQKKYRENNRDKIKESQKKYKENNPDRIKESSRKYKENNRDKIKESLRKYKELYPDRIKESSRKHKEKKLQSCPRVFLEKKLQRIKRRDKTCRNSAQHKFIICDIDIDYIMNLWDNQNELCALTNKKMTYKFNCLFSVSIDRINSNEGYIKGNIQLVCQGVNYAKNKFTNKEFLIFWNQMVPND